jgi:hypothetical protein
MAPYQIDLDKLLRFFRAAYAHALTLQQLMETHPECQGTEEEYNELRAMNDVHAAQEFEMIFQAANDPEGFGRAVRAFLNTQSKTGRVQ